MKNVTFDFDDTISLHVIDDPVPNFTIIEKIKEHQKAGDRVSLLTTRMDNSMDFVKEFIKEYDLSFDNIWNTNFEWKLADIIKKNIDIHYDDNPYELYNIQHNDTCIERGVQTFFVVGKDMYEYNPRDKDKKLPLYIDIIFHRNLRISPRGGWA